MNSKQGQGQDVIKQQKSTESTALAKEGTNKINLKSFTSINVLHLLLIKKIV